MTVDAFILCWNERELLPLTIKHYQKFCRSITIYDNYSDDGSDKIAESMGCKVVKFGKPGELNDNFYLEVKNHCWKGSDADYVIVCDADEILTSLTTGPAPKQGEKPTIYRTQGWQVTSNQFPNNDLFEVTNGWPFDNYSKSIMFDPRAIKEINYRPGAHRCDPVGHVVYSAETLYLLHYRQAGGAERLIKRYNQYMKRLSEFNRKHGHGIHYRQRPEQIRANFKRELLKSKPLV